MSEPAEEQVTAAVQKLCREGLVVTFETIGTIHQCALFEGEEDETDSSETTPSASLQWEVLDYGIPVIITNENGVVLCLADIETGNKLCEFPITSLSQYVVIDSHFHVITEPSGCYGISFADSAIGGKIMVYLKRVVACTYNTESDQGDEPIEEVDGEESFDEIDGPFHRRQSTKKAKRPHLDISEPQNFQHLSHVGLDASIGQLSEFMCWTDTLKGRNRLSRLSSMSSSVSIPMYNCKEVETVSTASFVQVMEEAPPPPATAPPSSAAPPPPAPPPPAIAPPPAKIVLKKKHNINSPPNAGKLMSSIAEELKKGVVLRPVGGDRSSLGSSTSQKSFDSLQQELKQGVVLRSMKNQKVMTLPMPPRRNKSEKLMFEISTFRRKKLRHVSSSDSGSMTDSPSVVAPSDNSLESVMKRGLESMKKKLSVLNIPNVRSVTSTGRDDIFES